jgi:hypothetical protein
VRISLSRTPPVAERGFSFGNQPWVNRSALKSRLAGSLLAWQLALSTLPRLASPNAARWGFFLRNGAERSTALPLTTGQQPPRPPRKPPPGALGVPSGVRVRRRVREVDGGKQTLTWGLRL